MVKKKAIKGKKGDPGDTMGVVGVSGGSVVDREEAGAEALGRLSSRSSFDRRVGWRWSV